MRVHWTTVCEAHSSLHGRGRDGVRLCPRATRRTNGSGPIRLYVSHATKFACYVGRQSVLVDRRLSLGPLGHRRSTATRDGKTTRFNKIEIGLGLNWVVRRHSVPEIRAPSLQGSQPMCLCRGSRTNQATPKATVLRHPTTRPTGDENRTQLRRGLTDQHPRATSLRHNVTRLV